MAVKIRLSRRGRKKQAMYDVVIADARSPRDGRFIEKLGTYNPNTNPATIKLDDEKTLSWVMTGAQPTDTVRAILSYRGIMFKKHLQVGVNKGAITQDEADAKFEQWLEGKTSQIQGKLDNLAETKASQTKSKLEAEAKVNQARLEAILAKRKVADDALAADVAAANADKAETAMAEEAEEAVVEAKASDASEGDKKDA
ncbi:MAG: small subunit ribosomal protein S16 [Cyclobacteriaceae bacterium]|jgi:small subunit ribosomal protein S16